MEPVVQILGAVSVLTAFVLAQAGRLSTASRRYLVLNVVGAGVLALDAAISGQPGFLLLEGVWAIVACIGLVRVTPTGGRVAG